MLVCTKDHLITMICLSKRQMWLADGRTLPIVGFRDAWNDETEDLEEAVFFVGGDRQVGYASALLADFAEPVLH